MMMKKFLLLALLAISAKTFSQGGGPTFGQPISAGHFLHHDPAGTDEVDQVTYETNSDIDLRAVPDDQNGMIFPPVQLFDAVMFWKWDTLDNNWILYSRNIDFTYDSAYNLTQRTGQVWNGSAWVNSGHRSFSYDDSNNQTLDLFQGWDGTDWFNAERVISTYDVNNHLEFRTKQQWKLMAWENLTQNQYIYDADTNRISEIFRSWYIDQWVDSTRELYTYDANHNLKSQTSQHWNGSFWENKELVLNTYDTNNNLTITVDKNWNTGAWENVRQSLYNYDLNNHRISMNVQSWSNTGWKDTDRVMYGYDASDNLRDILSQKWINTTWENYRQQLLIYGANHNLISRLVWRWAEGQWVISSQHINTYDPHFYKTGDVFRLISIDGGEVTDGDSTQYFFSIILTADELTNSDDQIIIYPNPNDGKFSIRYTVADVVEVFNVAGKRVYYKALGKEQTFIEMDLTQQGTGIYFVVLHQGRKIYSRKIEVQ